MSRHHWIKTSVFSAAVGILSSAAMPPTALAQTTSVKLFDATSVTDSGPFTDPALAQSFATMQRVLVCDETPVATLSSTPDGTGGIVVDNFLTVDGVNVCTGQVDCGSLGNCAANCFLSFLGDTGHPLTSYTPVPPIDISGSLAQGKNLVTFELMDWGIWLANSEIWLVTNCDTPTKVAICHKPGTRAEKTLLVAQSAVPGHLGHGDTLGSCP